MRGREDEVVFERSTTPSLRTTPPAPPDRNERNGGDGRDQGCTTRSEENRQGPRGEGVSTCTKHKCSNTDCTPFHNCSRCLVVGMILLCEREMLPLTCCSASFARTPRLIGCSFGKSCLFHTPLYVRHKCLRQRSLTPVKIRHRRALQCSTWAMYAGKLSHLFSDSTAR